MDQVKGWKKLCKQPTDTDYSNYQEILSFESENDDYGRILIDHDARIEQLTKERDATIWESKTNASLLKDLKETHTKIKVMFRDEIKKSHADEVRLKKELEIRDEIIELGRELSLVMMKPSKLVK